MRKLLHSFVTLAALAALTIFSAQPASAQFIGQPGWISDPTAVCSYPGRANCPSVVSPEPTPINATQVTGTSGDVAAATATATLTGVAAKSTYLTAFLVSGGGATGASVIACTVTGVITGTQTFNIPVPAGATLGIAPLWVTFDVPVISSAVNTSIVVSCPTFGAGNAHASVNAWGYVR